MCPKNASGDLDENGDRPMGFASRGRLDGAHGLVVYEIGDSGVHFVVMFRVPLLRSKWIRRGTNAFAFGFVHGHGPVGATAALYKEMEGSREVFNSLVSHLNFCYNLQIRTLKPILRSKMGLLNTLQEVDVVRAARV